LTSIYKIDPAVVKNEGIIGRVVMEQPSKLKRMQQMTAFYEKNERILDKLETLDAEDNPVTLRGVANNKALFNKYFNMGNDKTDFGIDIEKFGSITEAMASGVRNEVIVYFADINLYAVFVGILNWACARAKLDEIGLCGDCAVEIGKLLTSQTKLYSSISAEFDRKIIFASWIRSVEQAQDHINGFTGFCVKIGKSRIATIKDSFIDGCGPMIESETKLCAQAEGATTIPAVKSVAQKPSDTEKTRTDELRAKSSKEWVKVNSPRGDETTGAYYRRYQSDESLEQKALSIQAFAQLMKGMGYHQTHGAQRYWVIGDLLAIDAIRKKETILPVREVFALPDAHLSGGYVYFIAEEPFCNRVKIGMSKDPYVRVKELQTGNANKLVIRYLVQSPDYKALERTLHQICGDLRLVGEWFAMTESELVSLISAY
jgi:hypothetical protein